MAVYSGIYRNIQANVEFSAYIRLSGPYMRCYQLGGELRRSLELKGFVKVREHGKGWYSAKFSSQLDYDQAFRARSWRILGRYSIQAYRWQPNFQFGEMPSLRAGDIVEGRVERLPVEHCYDDVVKEIAYAVCEPLGCRILMVDSSSEGKLPRFLFEFNGSYLPLQFQINGSGLVMGLSYSRAKQCYNCHEYGHISWTCPVSNPEPRQWTRSSPNRIITPSSSGSGSGRTQFHRCTIVDPGESDIASSSGITSPPRTITKRMPAKGGIFIEQGGESRPTLYTIGEDVSEIDGLVKVAHSNDQRGNLRRVDINPHIGDGPQYTKRVICASIDGADAIHTLEEMCHNKGASLAVVFDISSVLDDQIGTRLGFSESHRAERTFQRVGEDGSALDVKGSCLLMWKRKEVRVDVSDVVTEPSSQHLKFTASWVIGESDEEEPDGLSHGIAIFEVGGPSNYCDSTTSGSSDGPDSEGPSSNPTAPKELSSESANVLPIDTPGGDALTSNHIGAFPGEERPHEAFTSSSSERESSYSGSAVYDETPPGSPDSNTSPLNLNLNYEEADANGSSGDERLYESNSEEDFNTDAEEIPCGSSSPSISSSSSEEDSFSSPDGDASSVYWNTNSLLPLVLAEIPIILSPDAERDEEGTISEEGHLPSPDGGTSSAHGNTNSQLPLVLAEPKICSPDAERDKEGTISEEEQLQMDPTSDTE